MKRWHILSLPVLSFSLILVACAPGMDHQTPGSGLEPSAVIPLGHAVTAAPAGAGIPLSDELNSAGTLASWSAVGTQHTQLDIGARAPGHLSMSFDPSTPAYSGWYQDFHGAFLQREVSGDFRVVTAVTVSSSANPGQAPARQYTAAGLMIRDPGSEAGNENWVVMNLGFQESSLATESKNTDDSVSVLTLRPTGGIRSAELSICRAGSTVRVFRRLLGSSSWELDNQYERPDLPQTLQVGMMANAWEAPADLLAEFDFVRFDRIGGPEDCTVEGMNLL